MYGFTDEQLQAPEAQISRNIFKLTATTASCGVTSCTSRALAAST